MRNAYDPTFFTARLNLTFKLPKDKSLVIRVLSLIFMLWNNSAKNKTDNVLPHLNPKEATPSFHSHRHQEVMFAKQARSAYISMKLTCNSKLRSQHWKQDGLHVSWQGDSSSRSHMSSLEPSRAKPLWGVMQVNRRPGGLSRIMWTLSIICACVCFCVYMCIFSAPTPACMCMFTSQPSCGVCQQKCWISVSCATLPAPEEPPDMRALRQPGHANSSSNAISQQLC